ncbi:MAG TPA: hypothetical protein VFO79_07245 [Xanthomonadales bacterium]|nr:hypothetical protein [Xanthomonadales bacterium]
MKLRAANIVRNFLRGFAPLLIVALACAPAVATAQVATVAGVPVAPFPTLHNLTLDWPIAGDTDNDGVVAVRFRRQGTSAWSSGMSLRRVPAGTNTSVGRSWANRHSGSVFDLDAGTTYEIELALADPDGGSVVQTLVATTRSMPVPAADATVKPATPGSLASVLAGANPGDIVQLAPGTYAGFQIGRDGSAGRPIVVRGTPGAVVTGEIGLFGRSHVMLQQLDVLGRIRFNGSRHVSIVGCKVTASGFNGDTIVSFLRAENAYIADNTLVGLTAWAESSLGASGNNLGEGIVVTGPGHVIARNRVRGFRDGISLMEDGEAVDQYSIDIVDNDISEAADDGIEADFCMHNCRIVRNRLTNTFIAMSSQPGLGGPTYFVRNSAYNVVHLPFKLYRGSVGDVVLHNTVVKHGDALNIVAGTVVSRAYFRNNLFIGGPAGTFNGFPSGSGRVLDAATVDAASSLDHDGYGTILPAFTGRLGPVTFSGIEQLRSVTTEAHARQVDLSVFANPVAFPLAPLTPFAPPSLAISPRSTAADAGEVIPNVNDGYAGSAPDLGAFESTATAGGGDPPLFSNGFE